MPGFWWSGSVLENTVVDKISPTAINVGIFAVLGLVLENF